MDRDILETRIAAAIAKLPTDLDGLIERGKAMERFSNNPDGAVPIREHLDAQANGGLFYNYADGAGNSDSLWILPSHDGLEAIYLCYDHESEMNFYAFDEGEDYRYQSELYAGIPQDLKCLLADGPEGELLNIKSPDGEHSLYHGSAILYLQDGQWTVPDSYRDIALTFSDDGGLRYIFDPQSFEEEDEES